MNDTRVTLSIGAYTISVHPIYGSGIKFTHKRDSGQMYYRDALEGVFRFVKDDFKAINAWPDNTKFELRYYLGNTLVGVGGFYKEDCKMDYDNEICEVKIATTDRYSKVLEGLENTYNLVKLAPRMHTLKYAVRPLLQLYVLGSKKLSNVFANERYEVDCEEQWDESRLTSHLGFTKYTYPTAWGLKAVGSIYDVYWCTATKHATANTWRFDLYPINDTESTPVLHTNYISLTSSPILLFTESGSAVSDRLFLQSSEVISPTTDISEITTIAVGPYSTSLRFSGSRGSIFARWIFAKEGVSGAYELPEDDLIERPRNYKYYRRAIGDLSANDYMQVSFAVQDAPTEYGTNSGGKYFIAPTPTADPSKYGTSTPMPICWDAWLPGSYWFMSPCYEKFWITPDKLLSNDVTLKDAYDIMSVLRVLMKEVDPSIIVDDSESCSQFLCSSAPSKEWMVARPYFMRSMGLNLYITPITNIKATRYSQAAQRGDISLGQVFAMLKGCFRCYWWIDDNNRLRIEHISAIRNGGSYTASDITPSYDITKMLSLPTGKTWAFESGNAEKASSKVSRYEYDWGDRTTDEFKGYALDINKTDGGNVDTISIQKFNADIDYIISNPEDVSNDSFALLCADRTTGNIPIVIIGDGEKNTGAHHGLQNGHLSFINLAKTYYLWEMSNTAGVLESPLAYIDGAWRKNGSGVTALGLNPNREQKITFPASISTGNNIIKTSLGFGMSGEMSLDCDSSTADVTIDVTIPMNEAGSIQSIVEKDGDVYNLGIRNLCDKRMLVTYVIAYPGYVGSETNITIEPEATYSLGTTTLDGYAILIKKAVPSSSQPTYATIRDGAVLITRSSNSVQLKNNSIATIRQRYSLSATGSTWNSMTRDIASGQTITLSVPSTYKILFDEPIIL